MIVSGLGVLHIRDLRYLGPGSFSGLAPDPADPDSPDGRFRILNEPARGRVSVYDRTTMNCVESVLSAEDGTWEISHLNPESHYVIIGWDGTGSQNAAIQDWVKPHVAE